MNVFSAATSAQTTLHLVIPHLFSHLAEINEPLQLTYLDKLLTQSSRHEWQQVEFYDNLFKLFNISNEKNLPAAAVSRLIDMNDSENHIWLRADPVHLHADRDRVLLFDQSTFELTQAEADQLVTELNDFFVNDALFFTAPTPYRWYIRLPRFPELITPPITHVIGRDIHKYMPRGRDQMTWRQRLNEAQMLLYQSEVNVAREQRGELSVNSVWFWGLGTLPAASASRWVEVWSEDPVAQGLAKLTQVPYAAPSKHLLNDLKSGDYLLTFTTGMKTDWERWGTELEQIWFKTLYQMLQDRQLAQVWIYGGDSHIFCATRNRFGNWWRRRVSWRNFVPATDSESF
jgi:hypothetical protein